MQWSHIVFECRESSIISHLSVRNNVTSTILCNSFDAGGATYFVEKRPLETLFFSLS